MSKKMNLQPIKHVPVNIWTFSIFAHISHFLTILHTPTFSQWIFGNVKYHSDNFFQTWWNFAKYVVKTIFLWKIPWKWKPGNQNYDQLIQPWHLETIWTHLIPSCQSIWHSCGYGWPLNWCPNPRSSHWLPIAPQSERSNHNKIHISETTWPILLKFSHNVRNTQGQILSTGEPWIPSVGWENPHFVSNSEPILAAVATLADIPKTQKNSYLRNYLADFNNLFTQAGVHQGPNSVNLPTLNSISFFLR